MSLHYYLLFNPDLKKYDMTTIKKGLYEDTQTNNRVTSIESFFKKYKDFDINIYKKFYPETEKMTMIETLIHMNINYDPLNTIYSHESFLKKYPLFKESDGIKKNAIPETYYDYHVNFKDFKEDYIIQSHDNLLSNTADSNDINHIDHIERISSSNLKLAHVFVHLFKIGGGEAYLKKFHKYNKSNLFDETLFINRVHHPHNIDTLFDFSGMDIIYYNTYEELNNYLHNYNIVIDHQLYWFEPGITQAAFAELDKATVSIIRVIHGAPIHYQDITPYNFTYSIELYKDLESHISWNNHIKHYINIGVESPPISFIKKKEFPTLLNDTIQILIIGRICEEKVPYSFLKALSDFFKKIETSNINPKMEYQFNFYGVIDKSYETAFVREINKINKINKTKTLYVKYHGFIHPDKMNDIYCTNHILMHPSQNEAGATVILESMSYGLPVICKNRGGMAEALGLKPNLADDYQFLCETDTDMFEKLLLIGPNNYNDISSRNRLKILENNHANTCFGQLLNEIKIIHDINSNDIIPNIIHYIFGLIPQTDDFSFIYFMSIYSNYVINKPNVIYFHCQYEPCGYWWDKARKYIKINYIRTDSDTMKWGKKPIVKYAHKADKLRLEILNKYGGVYMDIDTITIRPYHHLINGNNNAVDFVIGIQEENYLNRELTLYCNAILMSKRNSRFIKQWMEMYEKYFMTDGWCEASVHLPQKVLGKMDKTALSRIKILDKSAFYNPSYNEVDKIFELCDELTINNMNNNNMLTDKYSDLLTLHLWNSYSNKYYKEIDKNGFYIDSYINTLYGQCVKNVINYQIDTNNTDPAKICIHPQKHNLSIIMVYGEHNKDEKLDFKNILEQEYIYNLNVEIIIVDNGQKDLYQKIYQNDVIKRDFLLKMIDLYIIELNAIYSEDLCNKIGLEYANYETVFYCGINEELNKEEFIGFFDDSSEETNTKSDKLIFYNYLDYINRIFHATS